MDKSSRISSKNLKAHDLKSFLADLKSLTKSIVLIANVLPVFAGFWLALYFTDASFMAHLDTLLITIIGSTLTIAGALILNNWYEVDLDREMMRTQQRPTVTGNLSMNTILMMGIIASALGIGLMLFTTLEATIYAFLGWFTYVVLYTFWSKRKYTLNTMIGSVSGAFTPLIGWAAIESAYHIVPIVLFILLLIWQIPHTFAITIRRFNEYKAAGVPMLPVVYGFDITKRQTVIYIACLLPLPLFLTSLGMVFVTIATVINIVWLIIGIRGFFTKDDVKWANMIFYFSLSYLTIFFMMLIGFTLPFFN
ncbi:MAG TPA: heme o synthase [Virgibacillus sp.]|nr:heme o synthase [Virgibacillus sp.]